MHFIKSLIFIFIFFTIGSDLFAQQKQDKLSLIENNIAFDNVENSSLNSLGLIAVVFPVNPIFLIENKKFYAGLTKEFSLSLYPVGRLAAEYSLIFRKTDLNQLRFSYNYDIPVVASDFAVIFLSLGGGYFTDFKKYGYFPQTSANFLLPATDDIAVNAYFKVRNVFVNEDEGSDVFDVSLGFGTIFSL
ncbi:MAG TPA: hypothetical protein PKA90_03930 [Ignavibacteria bacterium]|nr:hypothetical protein [Ignavibacteria bacterium]HMR39558.1 hypothetical protein [Ignavibacteria bacterium]